MSSGGSPITLLGASPKFWLYHNAQHDFIAKFPLHQRHKVELNLSKKKPKTFRERVQEATDIHVR